MIPISKKEKKELNNNSKGLYQSLSYYYTKYERNINNNKNCH